MREIAHIALLIHSLSGGGVQGVFLNLAGNLARHGYQVDLLACRIDETFRTHIPEGVRVIALNPQSGWLGRYHALVADPQGIRALLRPVLLPLRTFRPIGCLWALAGYLSREQPHALLSATSPVNLVALWARRLAGTPLRVVISEHTALSSETRPRRKWRWRFLPPLIARTYPWADAIIAVSNGVADDLARTAWLPREEIATVYNPVVTAELFEQAEAPLTHPWFAPDAPPVLLGAGRLLNQKDFPTLMRAFARIRAQRSVRLMILGEGAKRAELEALAQNLGIVNDVGLPGFVTNPFCYMARSSAFVLSSVYEGLPGVLIQAMACGCPVISTNCPSGPSEILEGGRYGPLVPVGDAPALAEAILAVLDNPPDPAWIRARAAEFSVKRSTEQYVKILLAEEN